MAHTVCVPTLRQDPAACSDLGGQFRPESDSTLASRTHRRMSSWAKDMIANEALSCKLWALRRGLLESRVFAEIQSRSAHFLAHRCCLCSGVGHLGRVPSVGTKAVCYSTVVHRISRFGGPDRLPQLAFIDELLGMDILLSGKRAQASILSCSQCGADPERKHYIAGCCSTKLQCDKTAQQASLGLHHCEHVCAG